MPESLPSRSAHARDLTGPISNSTATLFRGCIRLMVGIGTPELVLIIIVAVLLFSGLGSQVLFSLGLAKIHGILKDKMRK